MAKLTKAQREALEESREALNSWLHQYAPEHCRADLVKEYGHRRMSRGGTLAYIAEVQEMIRAVLKEKGRAALKEEEGRG